MFIGRLVVSSLAGAATFALAATSASAEPEHHWRIQSLWEGGTINQQVFERFAERVEEMTDGRVVIEPLPVGSVVGVLETLDAVSAGVLDGHQTAPSYFTGRDPGFGVLGDLNGAYFGYEGPYRGQEIMENYGGLDLLREMYADYNIYAIGVIWWGVESLPSKVPLRGVDDFDGVKIRVPEGLPPDMFAAAGAAPVTMPGAEVYTALERGVIDAADWGTLSMNYDLGFHEITDYFIHPGIHAMPMGDVAVNMDRWNELSPDLQAILTVAVRDFARDMIQTVAREDAKALEAYGEQAEQISWSEEEVSKLRELARQAWEEHAERSEYARRALEVQLEYLEERGLIE